MPHLVKYTFFKLFTNKRPSAHTRGLIWTDGFGENKKKHIICRTSYFTE